MRVLTVNAGSSSLKLAFVENGARSADAEIETQDGELDRNALERFARGTDYDCSSHRIVHGGPRFTGPTRVDDDVRTAFDELVDLAPLHTPLALDGLDAIRERSDAPAIACFDTAFHSTLPPAAATYALPWEWIDRYGLRRYGFHGLNHAYVSRVASKPRIVSCHLGAGASLCAVVNGQSVDTTMGFTPLEGLVMATRAGDVDPGLLIWLQRHADLDPDELDDALEHRSGIKGLSGLSGDMKELLEARADGDERAALAYDVYIHRLRGSIAAMVASAGGIDALVFTAGVGEHSAQVREDACRGLTAIDGAEVLVIPAREDLELAREAERVLA